VRARVFGAPCRTSGLIAFDVELEERDRSFGGKLVERFHDDLDLTFARRHQMVL